MVALINQILQQKACFCSRWRPAKVIYTQSSITPHGEYAVIPSKLK